MRQKILPRLALVLGGFVAAALLIAGAELTLRGLGIGTHLAHDPFAGFSNLVPMFERVVRPDGTAIYRTAQARQRSVEADPAEFLADKPADGYRIFVVGGSSAAGVPYGYRYAFSGWLERRLRAAHPDRYIEVVNTAVSGYSSRRALMVVREIAAYAPDLLIVYSGHNESAERRYYKHLLEMDPRLFALQQRLYSTNIYRLASQLRREDHAPKAVRFGEHTNSIQMFAVIERRVRGTNFRDATEREYEAIHYRFNLDGMATAMADAGAAVMFLSISQDFADWPPGTSLHSSALTKQRFKHFRTLMAQGRAAAPDDCDAALALFARALEIDPGFAALHFEIGRCERELGRMDRAREHFRLASDLDLVPLGANTSYNEIVREVAESNDSLFVDIFGLMERLSPGGVVGHDLFVDFVHPNLKAHQRIAEALAAALRSSGEIAPAGEWRSDAFVEESAESILAANPELVRGEHLVRAFVCVLTRDPECVLAATRAVLAEDPDNARAAELQAQARSLQPMFGGTP